VEPNELTDRLSRIKTRLTIWMEAHQGEGEAAIRARQQLVLRYYGAVYRYLLGMLRDPSSAEEMTQEFSVRLLRGDFKYFNPERGRFRDFLKVALRHLVIDYWRQQHKRKEKEPQALVPEPAEPIGAASPESDLDRDFIEKWKEELLARTWQALEKSQQESGQAYYTMLRCKTDHPEWHSPQLAEQVGRHLGKEFTPDAARKLLQRARRRFADLLVEEVAGSLDTTQPDQVAEELIELGLMGYCRSAVQRGE
jgi:RNA polymerase sigma factor (sigma-70 family)